VVNTCLAEHLAHVYVGDDVDEARQLIVENRDAHPSVQVVVGDEACRLVQKKCTLVPPESSTDDLGSMFTVFKASFHVVFPGVIFPGKQDMKVFVQRVISYIEAHDELKREFTYNLGDLEKEYAWKMSSWVLNKGKTESVFCPDQEAKLQAEQVCIDRAVYSTSFQALSVPWSSKSTKGPFDGFRHPFRFSPDARGCKSLTFASSRSRAQFLELVWVSNVQSQVTDFANVANPELTPTPKKFDALFLEPLVPRASSSASSHPATPGAPASRSSVPIPSSSSSSSSSALRSPPTSFSSARSAVPDEHTFIKAFMSVALLSQPRADDYASWSQVGWALHSIFGSKSSPHGNVGLHLFKAFSARSDKFNDQACENMYQQGANKLRLGSLIMWAKEDLKRPGLSTLEEGFVPASLRPQPASSSSAPDSEEKRNISEHWQVDDRSDLSRSKGADSAVQRVSGSEGQFAPTMTPGDVEDCLEECMDTMNLTGVQRERFQPALVRYLVDRFQDTWTRRKSTPRPARNAKGGLHQDIDDAHLDAYDATVFGEEDLDHGGESGELDVDADELSLSLSSGSEDDHHDEADLLARAHNAARPQRSARYGRGESSGWEVVDHGADDTVTQTWSEMKFMVEKKKLYEIIVSYMNRFFSILMGGQKCQVIEKSTQEWPSKIWRGEMSKTTKYCFKPKTECISAFQQATFFDPIMLELDPSDSDSDSDHEGKMTKHKKQKRVCPFNTIFFTHNLAKSYQDVTFEPNPDRFTFVKSNNMFNLFEQLGVPHPPPGATTAWSKEELEDAIKPILDHLRFETCNEDLTGPPGPKFTYLLKYLAFKYKRPWERMDVLLAQCGPQGCGKTYLAYLIGYLMGEQHFIYRVGGNVLREDFGLGGNRELTNLFLVLDELERIGERELAVLKGWVTSDTRVVNQKFMPKVSVPNYSTIMIITNDERSISVLLQEGPDGRRWYILANRGTFHGPPTPKSTAYFDRLWKVAPSLFATYLWYFVDVEGFRPTNFPRTKARQSHLERMVANGKLPVLWLISRLHNSSDNLVFNGKYHRKKTVIRDYMTWAASNTSAGAGDPAHEERKEDNYFSSLLGRGPASNTTNKSRGNKKKTKIGSSAGPGTDAAYHPTAHGQLPSSSAAVSEEFWKILHGLLGERNNTPGEEGSSAAQPMFKLPETRPSMTKGRRERQVLLPGVAKARQRFQERALGGMPNRATILEEWQWQDSTDQPTEQQEAPSTNAGSHQHPTSHGRSLLGTPMANRLDQAPSASPVNKRGGTSLSPDKPPAKKRTAAAGSSRRTRAVQQQLRFNSTKKVSPTSTNEPQVAIEDLVTHDLPQQHAQSPDVEKQNEDGDETLSLILERSDSEIEENTRTHDNYPPSSQLSTSTGWTDTQEINLSQLSKSTASGRTYTQDVDVPLSQLSAESNKPEPSTSQH
jgi:hypothetical protein